MAQKKKYYPDDYVSGSAAPARRYEEPVREPRRRNITKEEERRLRQQHYVKENQQAASRFGALYTMFLVAAVVVTLMVCAKYISLINTNSDMSKKITAAQTQITSLKEKNDLMKLSIDTSIDYDYIFKVATEELGMVYPSQSQIIPYSSGESEYVIQYSDIPTN